jgi:hypothetical protein
MKRRVLGRFGAVGACAFLITSGFAGVWVSAAEEGEHAGHGGGGGCEARQTPNKMGATNMVFEHGACDGWTPDVSVADAESQDIALRSFQSLMEFCIANPTLGDLQSSGYSAVGDQSHWVNGSVDGKQDGTSTEGFIDFVAAPDHAIIDKEGAGDPSTPTVGIMAIEGWGLAHLGSLMRPHGSHGNAGDDPATEMLHLWCMPTIEEAFSTNNPGSDAIPGTDVLQAALTASQSGGIAAVSTTAGGAAAGGAPAAGAPAAGAPAVPAAGGATGVAPTGVAPNEEMANAGGAATAPVQQAPVQQAPLPAPTPAPVQQVPTAPATGGTTGSVTPAPWHQAPVATATQ